MNDKKESKQDPIGDGTIDDISIKVWKTSRFGTAKRQKTLWTINTFK